MVVRDGGAWVQKAPPGVENAAQARETVGSDGVEL